MMTNKVSIASCLQTAARPYLSYHLVCGVGSTHKVVVFRQSHVPTCLKITLFFQITDCYVSLSCALYIIRCKATAVLLFLFICLKNLLSFAKIKILFQLYKWKREKSWYFSTFHKSATQRKGVIVCRWIVCNVDTECHNLLNDAEWLPTHNTRITALFSSIQMSKSKCLCLFSPIIRFP